jgi:DNA polymerase alpha subunit B
MALYPRVVEDSEREEKELGHKVYERARVDVLRI